MKVSPAAALRIAGCWIRDYAYAAVWQLRSWLSRVDPASFLSGDGVPIVVLPGVYETWKFLQPLVTAVHARGHPVHVLPVLRNNRRPVAEAALQVADYLASRDLSGCVLLAHSKGGLVGKQVMADEVAGPRVAAMLAVATPFAGSRYGALMVGRTLRVFSPHSATILALARETAVNARIVSVWARFDPHIPEGSELAGAKKNVMLDTGGHFRVLAHPRVIAELAALAEEDGT